MGGYRLIVRLPAGSDDDPAACENARDLFARACVTGYLRLEARPGSQTTGKDCDVVLAKQSAGVSGDGSDEPSGDVG